MLYLVCYDIVPDKLRLSVANQLLTMGLERVQRSVFVGPLTPDHHQTLLDWLAQCLPDDDTVQCLVLPLTEYTVHQAYCRGSPPPDWTYLAGESHTLIL